MIHYLGTALYDQGYTLHGKPTGIVTALVYFQRYCIIVISSLCNLNVREMIHQDVLAHEGRKKRQRHTSISRMKRFSKPKKGTVPVTMWVIVKGMNRKYPFIIALGRDPRGSLRMVS